MLRRSTVLAVGAVIGAIIAMWPVQVRVLGSDGDCGPGALQVFRPHNADNDGALGADFTRSIEQQCKSRGITRLVLGASVFGGSAIIGATLKKPTPPAPPPGWWWDGVQWRPLQPPPPPSPYRPPPPSAPPPPPGQHHPPKW